VPAPDGPVLLADGTGLLVRCSRAARGSGLHAADGTPTATLMMLAGTLAARVRETRPGRVVVAWDGPGGLDWRRSLWGPYKRGRRPRARDGGLEEAQARELVDAAGIPQVTVPGFEADDVIAALWRAASRGLPGERIVIWSCDDDLLQLLDGRTERATLRGVPPDRDVDVERRWRAHPRLLPCLRALAGDASDGIPGVRGIGPARAVQALAGSGFRWPLPALDRATLGDPEAPVEAWKDIMELADPPRQPGVPSGDGFWEAARWEGAVTGGLTGFLRRYELSSLAARAERGALWQ
jgi:5'-3' exonuclease